MGLEHSMSKSRQCAGLSDPEGAQPAVEEMPSGSATATFAGEVKRGNSKFDEAGPNVLGQGKMEEEHSSNTR